MSSTKTATQIICDLIEEVSNEINDRLDKIVKNMVNPERVVTLIDHDSFRYATKNRFKIDYLKLKSFLLSNRIDIDTRIYCSEFTPSGEDREQQKINLDKFHHMLRSSGFNIYEKKFGLLERELSSDILEISKNPKVDTIVLVVGNSGHIPAIKKAKQNLVKVEVCFFKNITPTDLIEESSLFLDLNLYTDKLLRL